MIQSTANDGTVSGLVQQLFARVDANNDGQINGKEFQAFLEGLLGTGGGPKTLGLGSAADAVTTPTYRAMDGWNTTKLNDLSHTTPKYVFARATQDVSLGTDRASRSAGLERIAEYMRQHGYPNTRVTGDDTINIGQGFSDVDVLTGGGSWWWGPKG